MKEETPISVFSDICGKVKKSYCHKSFRNQRLSAPFGFHDVISCDILDDPAANKSRISSLDLIQGWVLLKRNFFRGQGNTRFYLRYLSNNFPRWSELYIVCVKSYSIFFWPLIACFSGSSIFMK